MRNKLRNLYVNCLYYPAFALAAVFMILVFFIGFLPLRLLCSARQFDEILYRLNNMDLADNFEAFRDFKDKIFSNIDEVK